MSITGDLGSMGKAVVNGLPVTGDSYQYKDEKVQGVMFVNFPTALHTEIADGDNPVNNYQVSGKGLGTMILDVTRDAHGDVTLAALRASSGKKVQGEWIGIKDIVGVASSDTPVTPTAATVNTSIIGDIKAINEVPYLGIKFASFGAATMSTLMDADSLVNQSSISGKTLGAFVIAYDEGYTNVAILVAAGGNPKDKWLKLVDLAGTVADVTPSGVAPSGIPVTGDISRTVKEKEGVYLHAMPYIDATSFAHKESPENISKLSGKTLGSMAVLGSGVNAGLYMSSGDKPTDKWVLLLALKGTASDITPV